MRNELYVALLAVTVAYVFWRGERSERQAAGILVGAVLLTGMLVSGSPTRFVAPEYGIFAADLIYYLAMLVLAILTLRALALWISAIIGAALVYRGGLGGLHVDRIYRPCRLIALRTSGRIAA